MRRIVVLGIIALACGGRIGAAQEAVRVVVEARPPVVLGDTISIRLKGLVPGERYRLVTEFPNPWGTRYRSINDFVGDSSGEVDLTTDAPVQGSHAGADFSEFSGRQLE